MDSAHRSVAEVELEGYLVAALAFIDERLSVSAALDEVEAAASRRRQSLASLPPQLSAGELSQLDEALDFVRRYYPRLRSESPEEEAESVPDPLDVTAIAPADQGGYVAGNAALADDAEIEVSQWSLAEEGPEPNGNRANGNGHGVLEDLELSAPAAEPQIDPAPLPLEEPAQTASRRSPLSRLWEEPECGEQGECALPEQQALPVVRGLLLLAFEAWLAGFAGWVATRFMAWPRGSVGYEVSFLYGHLMVLVGVATCAVAAWLIWRYRTQARRLALLVHAGAALVALDLLAWKAAAAPGNFPMIDAPSAAFWELLVVGWLAAGTAAYFIDLRAR